MCLVRSNGFTIEHYIGKRQFRRTKRLNSFPFMYWYTVWHTRCTHIIVIELRPHFLNLIFYFRLSILINEAYKAMSNSTTAQRYSHGTVVNGLAIFVLFFTNLQYSTANDGECVKCLLVIWNASRILPIIMIKVKFFQMMK